MVYIYRIEIINIINYTNLRKREITPNFETRKMKTSLG